ncbi:cytadherence high molecular weight protein 1 [Drosophila teissieri]|uniref:cytadherence high molecular weight protein 1 n=1 Tax=Drosophila teissieri TaxID=7243 RepID=UPI001CB9E4C9|nr:cytadherence high molecular weight protein 1 [Drosophila teissieri]XP_043640808.1 cytadherence high molecular weight protein 1 [Drosophila teissieri]XP_043640809.1 cytadherence high molecular weight protein 1 [Drosophila teissieri]
MADTINNKPSIQIRSGLPSPLPDKTPSPATKLLISHGKPNFTIAKSPKIDENGNGNPLSAQPSANNNYNAYKSANSSVANNQKFIVGTKFNGVFKPSNALNGNANGNGNGASEAENEVAKVVLRRPKLADSPPPAEGEDENVPEFIRRQRRIQERLAKENVLDFESRRSGYFTHVMISPDSPNRTSFVETMASPAIVPALEIPAPVAEKVEEEEKVEVEAQPLVAAVTTSALITEPEPEAIVSNGHSEEPKNSDVAPEEVAKAIEEVNQAVAGEDEPEVEATPEPAPEPTPEPVAAERKAEAVVEEPTQAPAPVEAKVEVVEPATPVQNGQKEEEAVPATNGQKAEEAVAATNGHKEEEAAPATNGQKEEEAITISHTNGQSSDGPSIPTPDPSGALGVNYEPKTVVSFSQELGSGENKYPDTVKVVSEVPAESNGELKELTKLKFDIQSDEQNEVQVTPVLRAD